MRIGLADELVDGDPHERAFALAAEVARGAVLAQALCKRVIDRGLSLPLADGLAAEREAFVEVFGTRGLADRRSELPRARSRQGDVHRPLTRPDRVQ